MINVPMAMGTSNGSFDAPTGRSAESQSELSPTQKSAIYNAPLTQNVRALYRRMLRTGYSIHAHDRSSTGWSRAIYLHGPALDRLTAPFRIRNSRLTFLSSVA